MGVRPSATSHDRSGASGVPDQAVEPRLQAEAVVEHQVGLHDRPDVPRHGLVHVGIAAHREEAVDLHAAGSQALGRLGDHGGGGQDPRLTVASGREIVAAREQEEEREEGEGTRVPGHDPEFHL
jgi:hypothetical protein